MSKRKRGGLEDAPQTKKPRNNEREDNSVAMGSVSSSSISRQLLDIEGNMSRQLQAIQFQLPITHIYNPLDYAAETHMHFVTSYANTIKKILFVGMNHGPFGMAQNGVRWFAGSYGFLGIIDHAHR